ncbi:50S ribosomal protein L11 methyltransferase [Sporohalobacter salinus]|uniref:50S ribosomal protein L11 methyltransferase n=1 Tax=Sporohalobacter salinus TaxID=1494606 RepID=UPI0019607A54|nr:50S ribosomal protein L11 methyltransferase [Sporohalobacter salinus]MBM7623145.1 ribosomal protein L11 methyltransferase [Sporohalobacter salinus]
MEIKIFTKQEALAAISSILDDLGVRSLIKEEVKNEKSDDNLVIKFYLPVDKSLEAKLSVLKSKIKYLPDYNIDLGSGRIESDSIPDQDWSKNWKENFKPQQITDRLVIKPTWEEYQATPKEKIIEIDPGMAFGTGTHETTTMCLEAIEEYSKQCSNLLDIGTGTGILSIGAYLLGIKDITAIDIDEKAVRIAKENLELNKINEGVEVKQSNLAKEIDGSYELVVANLLPHIILDLIPSLSQLLEEDSIFILSGITQEKKAIIEEKLEKFSLQILEVKESGEWVTLVGKRC